MFFKQLAAKDASLSYFFGCAGKGKAIAVDVVAGDEDWFMTEMQKANVAIEYVIDTHIHADHYSGGRALAEKLNVSYALHESAQNLLQYEVAPLQNGQLLDVGNVVVEVLHTPGHTLESICLLVTDKRRGNAPWFVMTGDTLLVGATGRPDLAGRESEMAGLLYDSIHSRLLVLPDEVEIYPGHQAGSLCGAGLSGKPSSTLGFEKRWNASLSLDRNTFIEHLVNNIPPRPADMDKIVAANIRL